MAEIGIDVPLRRANANAAAPPWRAWLAMFKQPPEPLASAVRVAQAVELVRILPWIVGSNLALAALAAIALADLHGPWTMAGWLAAVAVTGAPGARHWLRFHAAPPPSSVSRRFQRRTAIYSFVVAFPWLVLLTALFPYDSEVHKLAVIFVIAGVTAGAGAMLAAMPGVTLGYLAPILSGLVVALAQEDDSVELVMAAMTAAYMIYLSGVVAFRHEAFVESIAVREERAKLLATLGAAQERLAKALVSGDENVVIYDSGERLVVSNFTERSPLAEFGPLTAPGTTFADSLRSLVRAGAFTAGNRDEEGFVSKILAGWRNPPSSAIVELADGKFMKIAVRAIGGGERAVILSDATESVMNARAAREHEKRLADFAGVSGEWWWEQDADLRFTRLSDRVADYLGAKPDRYVGMRRDDLVDPTYDTAAWNAHRADLAARRPFRDFRYRTRVDDGAPRYLSISGKPVFGAGGQFRGYRGVTSDVTADVEAAETLRVAKEQAVYASHVKSQFLAHMSHELRTPLNAVIGYSDMMAQQALGPLGNAKYEEYAGHIRDSGQLLLGLIDEILEMSALEAGGRKLAEEPVDLRDLVRKTVPMVEWRANESGLTLIADMKPPLPGVKGDARALKQILLNLLVNSVKFTPRGGRVTLAVAAGRDGVEFRVTDTGIGMSAEAIAAAWTPFARGDSLRARDYPGTGLGLPLVKALTELHGGTVEIQSVVDVGTTVTVRLPASRVVASAAPQLVSA